MVKLFDTAAAAKSKQILIEPYESYRRLLVELGLAPWKCNLWEEICVGEVVLAREDDDQEEATRIQIYVSCMAAQFYRFVIYRKSEARDYEGMERVEVKTGSGTLERYWQMALAVEGNGLAVGKVERIGTDGK